jgi:hypothetical protein
MRKRVCYRVRARMVTPKYIARAMAKEGFMRSAQVEDGEREFCTSTPQEAARIAERDLTAHGMHVVRIEVLTKAGRVVYKHRVKGM